MLYFLKQYFVNLKNLTTFAIVFCEIVNGEKEYETRMQKSHPRA